MAISMYQASVPVFTRLLTNLKAILQKAAAHAQAKKIDESALLQARLYPDMFTLVKQVQLASDFARGTGARLAGKEPPSFEDNEKSFAELVARVDRTLDYLRTLKARRSTDRKVARSCARSAASPSASPASTICFSTRCRTSSSTRRPPTRSFATTASKSERATSSALWTDRFAGDRTGRCWKL